MTMLERNKLFVIRVETTVQEYSMKIQNTNASLTEETDADRRNGVLSDDALSLDLVSAFAGDRPLTEAERDRLSNLSMSRGPRFFSDLLYAISYQHFSPELAEELWVSVLRHKNDLSTVLGRNVRVAVAALDYLSNITANMGSAAMVSEAHIQEIIGLSLRDGLTGLFNHTYFHQQIDVEVRRYVRYGSPVSLMLIDIDDFKTVNDTYGHPMGDRVLATMGKTLMRVARDSDICCRYGGEEFAVILPFTDVHVANTIANRMKIELMDRLSDSRTVTVSIGVAVSGKKTVSYQDLVDYADAALYQAKRNGKNRVLVVVDGEVLIQ